METCWMSIHGNQSYEHFNKICYYNRFWYMFNLWDILFDTEMVDWYKRHRIPKKTFMNMVCRGNLGDDY